MINRVAGWYHNQIGAAAEGLVFCIEYKDRLPRRNRVWRGPFKSFADTKRDAIGNAELAVESAYNLLAEIEGVMEETG